MGFSNEILGFSLGSVPVTINRRNTVLTVDSRKSRTLFINYDFCWLMVAEIFRNYQLKRKLDGKSIANFVYTKSLLSTDLTGRTVNVSLT